MSETPIRSGLVLRAMLAVELRTLLRGRNQVLGLVIPMVVIAAFVVAAGLRSRDAGSLIARMKQSSAITYMVTGTSSTTSAGPTSQAQNWPGTLIAIVRWIAIALGGLMAAFMSVGYGTQAILAAFAGEKDARTLEVLLASPIPDTRLLLLKCASVLLPTVAIGYLYLLIATSLSAAFLRGILNQIPVHVLAWALLGGLPVMLLINIFFTGLGAAVSIKSENLKGAGHLLGGIAFLVFFAAPYSIPLLSMYPPALHAMQAVARAWIHMPFVAQYAMVLLTLAIPAAIFLGIARALFHRDRLLT